MSYSWLIIIVSLIDHSLTKRMEGGIRKLENLPVGKFCQGPKNYNHEERTAITDVCNIHPFWPNGAWSI